MPVLKRFGVQDLSLKGLGPVQGETLVASADAKSPFSEELVSLLLSFCDRKRKKKLLPLLVATL